MIHYHGTPFSGPANAMFALAARHACVSFAAPDCMPLVAELCQSYMLDNGAFSAWTRKEKLDIDGFRTWVDLWSRHPGCDWYLIPDVIDGNEAENDALLDGWPGGVPVWHLHESLDRLERLCHGYPRIAFGSSGEYAVIGDSGWWQRMTEAMRIACDPNGIPRTKLHGLRMLDPAIFSHFPFASADSTNVARNVGVDSAWQRIPYAPASKHTRALILLERIERHASASVWNDARGVERNMELLG